MREIEKAENTLKWVRAFYSEGFKSSNKMYFSVDVERIRFDHQINYNDGKDEHRQKNLLRWSSGFQQDFEVREKQTSDQLKNFSPAFRGKQIVDKRWNSGNCGEMACVSSYISALEYHVNIEFITIGRVTHPGDHAFCMFGKYPMPEWKSVNDLSGNESIIIDPWLNIACYAGHYKYRAGAKLHKWTQIGKRVAWYEGDPKQTKNWGWYTPLGKYSETFLRAPLSFKKAWPVE